MDCQELLRSTLLTSHVHGICRKEGIRSHNSDNCFGCPCFVALSSCEWTCYFTESNLLRAHKNSIYNILLSSLTHQTPG